MARTTRGTRILAALGIAIMTASGMGGAAHAAPAQARSATYTAPSGSYHFAYPAAWTQRHPQGLDVSLVDPDGNVVAVSSSVDGTITDSKAVLNIFVKNLGETPIGKARYHTYHLANGRPLQWAGTLVRMKDGQTGMQVVEFASMGGRTSWLAGTIEDVQAATAQQDADQLAQVTASFSVEPGSAQ